MAQGLSTYLQTWYGTCSSKPCQCLVKNYDQDKMVACVHWTSTTAKTWKELAEWQKGFSLTT